MLFGIEAGLSLAIFLIAIWSPEWGSSAFARAESVFARIADRPAVSVMTVGMLALTLRVAILPIAPVPDPTVNDEFSHLLIADTLTHGRLANPVHPMWMHFETFHELVRPSYASMYPPAQGVFLAIGQALMNEPFAGVCLSLAVLCGSICWMLQGWLSPRWALVGGLIAVARLATFSYWANSYWGGAAAATGGALALGALIRIMRFRTPRHAIWLGAGLALLANSRPYEGLVLAVSVPVALMRWLVTQGPAEVRVSMRRILVPLALVLVVTGSAMAYYNWRITGSPLRLPQAQNRSTYAVAPYFLWQSPRPEPMYNHAEMQAFYVENELGFYKDARSAAGMLALEMVRIIGLWCFYVGPALMLPIVVAAAAMPVGVRWRDFRPESRFLIAATLVSIAGLAFEVFFLPHYAAPMTSMILALVLMSMRRVRCWEWKGKPAGLFISRSVPALCFLMILLRAAAGPLHVPLTPAWPATWYNLAPVPTDRSRIAGELRNVAGRHLVFVRYALPSRREYDWVYNDAEIDQSNIVWARDMGSARNAELMQYYAGRQAWVVEPDQPRPSVRPYQDPAPAR